PKSKTIAERAAWEFIAREAGSLELSVINPVLVLGPVLSPDFSPSIQLIRRMMRGGAPGFPKLCFGIVDVRDVADLHVMAMTQPAAKGERFLAVAGDLLWLVEIAEILKRRMGAAAKRVPSRELPNWAVRVAALFDSSVRLLLSELGKRKNASHAKAARLL